MTTKNASAAKTVVAAALASALAMASAAAPALAATATTVPEEVPIVAQSCSSDWAVDAAVVASPVDWGDVDHVDWYYDADSDDYVVTVTSWWGDWWEVRVDAATGNAWCIF